MISLQSGYHKRKVSFSSVTETSILEKQTKQKNPSSPNRTRTYNLTIGSTPIERAMIFSPSMPVSLTVQMHLSQRPRFKNTVSLSM